VTLCDKARCAVCDQVSGPCRGENGQLGAWAGRAYPPSILCVPVTPIDPCLRGAAAAGARRRGCGRVNSWRRPHLAVQGGGNPPTALFQTKGHPLHQGWVPQQMEASVRIKTEPNRCTLEGVVCFCLIPVGGNHKKKQKGGPHPKVTPRCGRGRPSVRAPALLLGGGLPWALRIRLLISPSIKGQERGLCDCCRDW